MRYIVSTKLTIPDDIWGYVDIVMKFLMRIYYATMCRCAVMSGRRYCYMALLQPSASNVDENVDEDLWRYYATMCSVVLIPVEIYFQRLILEEDFFMNCATVCKLVVIIPSRL